MRTTVGPLPSAVYWRRRAVVLGASLLAVLIVFASCRDAGDNAKPHGGAPGVRAPGIGASGTPDTQSSFEDAPPPGDGRSLPPPSDAVDPNGGDPNGGDPNGDHPTGGSTGNPGSGATAGPGGVTAGPDINVAVPPEGQCTDSEMSVTPVLARTVAGPGGSVEILLKIKNISTRTCARDVGADLQEVYIKQGARKIWSSDVCGTGKGSEMRQFGANAEREYWVTWNGRQSSQCAAGLATGPAPAPGDYQVFGRLGSKLSGPVALQLSA